MSEYLQAAEVCFLHFMLVVYTLIFLQEPGL